MTKRTAAVAAVSASSLEKVAKGGTGAGANARGFKRSGKTEGRGGEGDSYGMVDVN